MNSKMNHPLITVDGRTLMDRPLEPPNFVVDTLISQGLHILAGSPKVGKSWLALWLAVTVAKGEPVWNMTTKQGTTLYLCLEDSVLRIQNRLFEITEDAPDSVHFCTECAHIGQGLEEQVDAFIAAHPDTVLVIIDTLQMVRPIHDATYANDYRDLSVLKRLADRHGIAILLIHHLRKEKAEDVFHRISGTTAISGAVDSSFTLVEERRGSENVWELVSDSGTQVGQPGEQIAALRSGASTEYPDGVSPKKKAIAAYLREHPGVTSKSLIARELQMYRSTVQRYYDELRAEFREASISPEQINPYFIQS